MGRIEEFGTFVKRTYREGDSEKRDVIRDDYFQIEEKTNLFYKEKLEAKELADFLGSKALGLAGEHSSSQIYAYENLIKSIAETKDEKDVEDIVQEIYFDIAATDNPNKRAYFLGILNHYSNLERIKEIYASEEEEIDQGKKLRDRKKADEKDIIMKIRKASEKIKKSGNLHPKAEKAVDYVLNNFPRDTKECETARLIAAYYDKEARATRMPAAGKKNILDENIWKDLKGSGVPRYIYDLHPGWHPSQEKLDEADRFGLELHPVAAKFEGDEKVYVEYKMNPELARAYNRRIRFYMDKKNYQRVDLLERALKERIWRQIKEDPGLSEDFPSIDDFEIIKQTIRDWPEDVEMNDLLESDFQKV